MTECTVLPNCIFFNDRMAPMPALAEVYKRKYCKDDFEACARYRVFKGLGRAAVPEDLLPNEIAVAHRLLEKRGSQAS